MAEGGGDSNYQIDDVITASAISRTSRSAALAKGNSVAQTFTNSKIECVGGDKITHHYTLHGDLASEKGGDYGKLVTIVNNHTRHETTTSIREDFKDENLHEPPFEVFPQMRGVKAGDYYKGHVANSSDSQIFLGYTKKGFRNQLPDEVRFHHQHNKYGKSITMEEVMEVLANPDKLTPDDVVAVTAIVASAGSGKTTLTRRIARKALGVLSTQKKGEGVPVENGKLKMIHYIELKDIREENHIKTSKFLFGGLYKSESDEDDVFEWLLDHQSEAMIIFDGLDQVNWDFDESSVRKIRPYDEARASVIMYNILSRKILRHVKIIVTSREFKVSELPAKARPGDLITLNGLAIPDAYKLFTFLLGANGKDIWNNIERMSPRLLQLVSVPVFLILIAVVMGRDPNRHPPSTVTELYSRIITVFQSVENIRNRKEIFSIIKKLKAMAFHGITDGRVVFDETDLKRFEVSAEEVQDLMTKVPGSNILSRHLFEGDFTFYFCHQSMQEFLAASFVSEMELEKFSFFNDRYLHETQWSVVRRFVTGIIYMKSPSVLHGVTDQLKKQEVLGRSIHLQLEDKTAEDDKYIRMELYTAIYESDDDVLTKQLSVIDAYWIPLGHDEAHIVGSLAARKGRLISLNLEDCSVDDKLFSIIPKCLMNPIHVDKVNLRGNNLSANAVRSLLRHRRIRSLHGNLDWRIVRLNAKGCDFKMRNDEDFIRISGDVAGHFNIKVGV